MKLTDKEIAVLKALAFNHYGDGHCTWAWATNESEFPSGITGKELSGVLGNLAKKGLIIANKGEDASISTTEAGIEEMHRLGWDHV